MRDLFILSALLLAWYWLRRPRRQRVGGWVDLKAYYKTAHWQEVRRLKRKQAGGRCEKKGVGRSRKKMNWINVKDKLPDNRVGKIVYCADDRITRMYYDAPTKRWIDTCGNEHTNITHWMELPSPPSGIDG